MKNYGLDLQKEMMVQDGTEHVFGALSQPCILSIPEEIRDKFLPKGELQFTVLADMMDCATRAPNNIYASKFTYGVKEKRLNPANIQWLKDNGYIDTEGNVDFSDAFNAILSGTTKNGNSLKDPCHSMHRDGLIPKKMLPLISNMTWEQYHDPKRITQEMKDLGKEFLRRFELFYEKVYEVHYNELLKEDELVVALHAWENPVNGVYLRTLLPENHAVKIFQRIPPVPMKKRAFDNYIDPVDGDYVKILAADFNFLDYGYRPYIAKENVVLEGEPGTLAIIWGWLYKMILWITSGQNTPMPAIPSEILPEKPAEKPNVLLDELCLAMKEFEGWAPGSRSQRNNNPGNCRYSRVGYLPKYGIVKEDRNGVEEGKMGYAIFESYAIGWMYMQNLIKEKAKKFPNWNLVTFIGDPKDGWAPALDNNHPETYATFIGRRMKVNPFTFTLKQLL